MSANYRVLDDPGLPNHRHLDPAGIPQLILDLARDLLGDLTRLLVTHLLVVDHDPELTSGLDRVRLVDTLKLFGNCLEVFQTLDVVVEGLPPSAGARGGYRIGYLNDHRFYAVVRNVTVVRCDAVDHPRVLTDSLRELDAEFDVVAVAVGLDTLADVVQATTALRDLHIRAHSRRR
jgi:hypothetical protein